MSQGDRQLQCITDLQSCLKHEMQVSLNAVEIADLLWLAQFLPGPVVEAEELPKIEELPVKNPNDVVEVVSESSVAPEFKAQSETPEESKVPIAATSPESSDERSVVPIKIPDVPALPRSLALARALRPLMRKVRSMRRPVMDEAGTVVRIVDEQLWSPVMEPTLERWLEVAIVVEETNLLEVWQDTILEFQTLMERHGAFRDVRSWQVATAGGDMQLFRRRGKGVLGSAGHRPRELLDPTGRRVIVFVSDCTSVGWASGRVPKMLRDWAKECPVALLQLLPERFWERSALGQGDGVWLGSRLPGELNDRLVMDELDGGWRRRQSNELTLPIVTLDEMSLRQWARLVVGNEERVMAGVVLDKVVLDGVALDDGEQDNAVTAEQLVRRWKRAASPMAMRLSQMMAAVPVSWGVIRLIQRCLLREAGTVHVAEVFLSGMVRQDGLSRTYDFVEGAREMLLRSVFVSDTEEVMEVVAEDLLNTLPEEVKSSLTREIERRLGRSMRSFEAFLVPDLLDKLEVDELVKGEMLPFASVAKEVLSGLGGEYATLVQQLDHAAEVTAPIANEKAPPSFSLDDLVDLEYDVAKFINFPALQDCEYESATITAILDPFNFETATIAKKKQFLRRSPTWEIQKRSGVAWGYTMALDGEVGLDMIAIAGGSFMMGAPKSESKSTDDERPQHEVTLQPFYLGRFAITQAQWRVVAGYPLIDINLDPDPSDFKGDNRPVENVSWDDAQEFCKRLSAQTGKTYRLPSEAQWEYACRGGTVTPFHFGETIAPELVNYDGNYLYGEGTKGEYRKQMTEVGSFPANNWGLYDMHGNVWEWCEDNWHSNYEGAPNDGSSWLDLDQKSSNPLLRGGSWNDDPEYCRSACRFNLSRVNRGSGLGFRVSCDSAFM